MFGVIYLTENLLNGKIYIGSDSKKEGKGDPQYLGSGVLLLKAIKKYGKENFKKTILFECKSQEELKIQETKFIREYQSFKREIGYNISDGYWGGDTLSQNPNLDMIRDKISKKSKELSKEITIKRKKFFIEESKEGREIRIANVKKGMINIDKSFFRDPEYIKNLSEGIKNSKKFQNYIERRTGQKRGKYSVDKDLMIQKREEKLKLIQNKKFRSILEKIKNKDSSTFSCYLQVYLHFEGIKIIPDLEKFLVFLEERIYSESLTLLEAKNVFRRLNLHKIKLGKSSTVIKSIYNFREFGSYPARLVEISKKF